MSAAWVGHTWLTELHKNEEPWLQLFLNNIAAVKP